MGVIPSGRLNNLKDVDKWSSLSFSLSVRRISVFVSWIVLVKSDGSYSDLSPEVHGGIALSINTNTKKP